MRTFLPAFFLILGCDNQVPEDVPSPQAAKLAQADAWNDDTGDATESSQTEEPIDEGGDMDTGSAGSDDSALEAEPVDEDGDGWSRGEDCDDHDARIHPGAPEFCDGIDTDCDGRLDPPDAVDATIWYRDVDRDGYGLTADTVPACQDPGPEWASVGGDCDDDNEGVHPDAEEICDGLDNDCDGVIDPGDSLGMVDWFLDVDRDGHGDPATRVAACVAPDEYWVETGDDCDDRVPQIHPGALEFCDGVDSDCDGVESTGIASFFSDADGPVDVTEDLLDRTYDVVEAGTLRICSGSWSSRILVDADPEDRVVIEGVGDVVVDAESDGTVIEVVGDLGTLEVRNLQLTGGAAIRGGAIYADEVNLVVEDVDLRNNEAEEFGGAIFVHTGDIALRDCLFTQNISSGFFLGGGAVYLGHGTLRSMDTDFDENHSEGLFSSGGAIHVLLGDVFLKDTVFDDNTSTWFGGALYLASGSLELIDSWLEGNQATMGGGAYVGGDVFMLQSLFLNNEAMESAGGLFLNSAAGGSTFVCETLDSGSYGFLHNDAGMTGGAVQISSVEFSSISSDGCDWGQGFSDNSGGDVRMAPFDVEAGLNATFTCDGLECIGEIEMILEP